MYRGAKKDYECLRQYAADYGVKIRVVKDLGGDAGLFDPETLFIILEKATYESMVLTLLHELGHMRDYKSLQAGGRKNADTARMKAESDMSEKDRWNIYIDECHGISWMLKIARELELNIPDEKVCVEQELDRLVYKAWAKDGSTMTWEEKNHHRQILNKMWCLK